MYLEESANNEGPDPPVYFNRRICGPLVFVNAVQSHTTKCILLSSAAFSDCLNA